MNLSQLEYLDAVVKHGGVRKAAAALHVTPQAVSSAIKKLEAEIGAELLDRSTREAIPTPKGKEIALHAQEILLQVQGLKQIATQKPRGVSPDGHFRLYAPCLHGRGSLFAEDWYDSFVSAHRDIHLDVWHQPTSTCFESLINGISDAAISFEKPHNNSLDYKQLGEKELKVLSYSESAPQPQSMSMQALLDERLAVPINLGPCLASLQQCPEAQLQGFKFRDVEYSIAEQVAFLQSGGRILSFSDSELAHSDAHISECSVLGSQQLALPVYFCYKKCGWSERHQIVFWHLISSFNSQ